ncbi:hypothetical protein HDU79_003485 [Rhizoclosmatium sp. JEL0117]|nr:hypothetical protein HDU79_003485 [Rhizoclosmatium sp. JEL0117]
MGVCSACESRFKDLVVATCGPDLTSPLRVLSLLQVLLADTSKLPDQIAKLVPNLVISTEAEPEVPKRQKIDFGPHRSILQCFIDAGVRSADSKAVEKIANALGIPTINLKGKVESVVPVVAVEGHEKEPNLDVRVLKRTRVTSARDQIAADDSNDPIDATHWTGMQKIRWRLANATNDQWNKAEDKAAVLRGEKPIPEYLSPAELSKIQDYRLQRLYDEAKACRDVGIDIILSTMCCDKVKHVNYGKHAEVLNRLYYTNAGFTWGAQWIGAKARLHRDEAVQRTEVVANQNQKELQNQVNRLLMDLLENAYQKEFPDKPLPTKAGVTMVKHRGLQRVENPTDPNEALIHDTLVETNNGISLLASAATAIPSEIVPITAPAAERVPQLNRTQEDNIDENNAIWRCDVQKNEAVLVLAGGRYHGTGSKRRYVEEHVPGIVQSYNPHLKQFTVHTPHNCKTDANVPRNKILTSRDPVFGQAEIADIMKDSAETEVANAEPLKSDIIRIMVEDIQPKLQQMLNGEHSLLWKEFFLRGKKGNHRWFNLKRLANYKTHNNRQLSAGIEVVLSPGERLTFKQFWSSNLSFPPEIVESTRLKNDLLDQVIIPEAIQYLNEFRQSSAEEEARREGRELTVEVSTTSWNSIDALLMKWVNAQRAVKK